MFNVAEELDTFEGNFLKNEEEQEEVAQTSQQYKKPAFSVENPQNTFITVEKVNSKDYLGIGVLWRQLYVLKEVSVRHGDIYDAQLVPDHGMAFVF